MATINQIHSVRIDISDPPDIILITSVASSNNLPANPTPQTAYYIIDTGLYMQTEETSGASPSDYNVIELILSDTKIGELIDEYGINKAPYKSLIFIASKLASKIPIVRNQSGADSTEYTELLDMYAYYKKIIDDFKDIEKSKDLNSTGRYGASTAPEIAGDNI